MTDRIWLKSYPPGVPADIDVEQFDSLVALIDDCFKKHANRVAYSFMGRDISYKQTDSLSQAFRGLSPGPGSGQG
jgi:long-chain acyl-CoA synthetase